MHAIRTPLVGIGFAFAVLLVETLTGSALMTQAENVSEMREQQLVEELRAAIHECEVTCTCRVTHVANRRRCN